jgi:hypothetical protein
MKPDASWFLLTRHLALFLNLHRRFSFIELGGSCRRFAFAVDFAFVAAHFSAPLFVRRLPMVL